MSDIQTQLKDHLNKSGDWEKMETPIPGVFIVRVPATKTRPALLFLEFNPIKEDGKPLKKRGLFIGSKEVLEKFSNALIDDRAYNLIQELEKVNPIINKNGATKKLKM